MKERSVVIPQLLSDILQEELTVGLRCVGAPILDYRGYPLYSLSVAGPKARLTDQSLTRVKEELIRHCKELSAELASF